MCVNASDSPLFVSICNLNVMCLLEVIFLSAGLFYLLLFLMCGTELTNEQPT